MDIRYRLKSSIEKAPLGLKIKYYQARYDGSPSGQMICLLQAVWKHGSPVRKKRFADYAGKQVYTVSSLMPQLYEADVISFDIFDTLLWRTVSRPADVFVRMEQRLAIPDFAERRILAEKEARQYADTASGTGEIAIEDIYRRMLWAKEPEKQIRIKRYMSAELDRKRERYTGAGSDRELARYICAELDMERECCRADQRMLHMVNRLLADGKRVIAVSDMYLHQAQVLQLLHHCGYTGLKEIYVSCDYRAGKSDGRLFPLVMGKIGREKSLIHIGDNFYADVYRQKPSGIRAIHYL